MAERRSDEADELVREMRTAHDLTPTSAIMALRHQADDYWPDSKVQQERGAPNLGVRDAGWDY
jgi:hypothetical protein